MRHFRKHCCGIVISALVALALADTNESVLAAPETELVRQEPMRDWGGIIEIPSAWEIAEFNKNSASRSPYITGWLDIGAATKYVGYSIDFKADYLPYGTYFCCANMWMDLTSLKQEYEEVSLGSVPSFYAGLQMWDQGKGSGSIMSFWDIDCKDSWGKQTTIHAKLVYPEDKKENIFTHEGNGVNYLGEYTWEPGCWYRMLLQCVRSEQDNHTLVEQWICNLETGEWTKLCCYDTGIPGSCFVGNAAVFLENYLVRYAGDIRTVEYKNIRIHPVDSEAWVPIRQVSMLHSSHSGSFCYGADNEQFWMISTGLENRSGMQSGESRLYQVTSCQSGSPY